MKWVTANPGLILLPLAASLISVLLTAATIVLCRRRGWVLQPRADRWHRQPVAQFGGVAIVLAFLAVASLQLHQRLLALACLTALIGAIGFCDDLRSWKPATRLAVELLIAALAASMGVVYPLSGTPWLNVGFTLAWIVGITNAFNLLDNMDGLTAGIAVIAGIAISLLTPDAHLRLLTLIFVGAIGGFLVFNFKPAKIFMGDTGSLAIGFYLACASVLAVSHISTVPQVRALALDASPGLTSLTRFVPAMVLLIPVLDTVLVSVTRRINGRAISAGARDHSSHRLVVLGISERGAVLLLYGFGALSGMVAVFLERSSASSAWIVLGLFLLGVGLFWLHLARLKLPDEYLSRTNVWAFVLPGVLRRFATAAAAVLLDACVIVLSLSLALQLNLGRLQPSQFVALCGIAMLTNLAALAVLGVYRRRSAASLRLGYALARSAVAGWLAFIAAVMLWLRSAGLSRAVLAGDLILTFLLLAAVRFSDAIFDRVLRPAKSPRLILVNAARPRFAAWLGGMRVSGELPKMRLADPEEKVSGSD